MKIQIVLIFTILQFSTTFAADRNYHPVILVPGDGGSQLEAKLDKPKTVRSICQKQSKDWFTLWLDADLLLPFIIDCWADNMRLKYDPETHKTQNNDGVEIRVPGFGNTSTVEYLGKGILTHHFAYYFHYIVEALVQLGYQRGVNIHGAPYDFRKAPNEQQEYFKKVVTLIEETYAQNGDKSVILLTHSMGSTMMLYLLNHKSQAWKDKYIRAQVSISGVWAGTVQAMKVFAVGDNLGSPIINSKSFMVEQRTNPSLNWLMPNLKYWSDDNLVEAQNINITKKNFEEFYKLLKSDHGLGLWHDTKDLIKDLKAPKVEVFCIYSHGLDTVEKLGYYQFPDSSLVKIYGDGDNTVNLKSLEACKSWRDKQKQPVHTKSFYRLDHLGILYNDQVVKHVQNTVKKLLYESWKEDNVDVHAKTEEKIYLEII